MPIPPVWRISTSAALLGLGQNGLLVALPVLVATSDLSLSRWGGLILLGAMLFLAGSPFWGGVADRRGPRPVVVQALLGYTASFGLVGGAVWLGSIDRLSTMALLVVAATARVVYGLTVSGMVPACQRWSLALHPDHDRVRALACVSAGLTGGRLLGPLLAVACLALSVHALFAMLCLAGLFALLLIWRVPDPIPTQSLPRRRVIPLPPARTLPWLVMALLLAMSISLMQLGLPPALQAALAIDADRTSYLMGALLFVGALGALAAQISVIRGRFVAESTLLITGAAAMATGYAVLTRADALWWFGLGLLAIGIGSAFAVPGYTAAATDHPAQGGSAGFVGMSHTLGYGAALLVVTLLDPGHLLHAALATALLLLALSPFILRRRRVAPAPYDGAPPQPAAESPRSASVR